jgi:UDP-N-acetylmuramate--alanine ligase
MLPDLLAAAASTIEAKPAHVEPVTPSRHIALRDRSAESLDLGAKHVHFIGIGGSGMSGLAQMFMGRGAVVSGSDREQSDVVAALEAKGIAVTFDQSSGWLPERCDLVVASAAVKHDHPQMLAAADRGIATLLYAEALGRVMLGSTGIAIAGTHGKSTTTAMLGCALTDAGLDPNVIVGATCPQLSSGCLQPRTAPAGFRLGSVAIPAGSLKGRPGILVAEACEYNRSFHNFRPTFACINNVEADHLDVYGTLDAVVESFREFASLLPSAAQGGKLLIGHEGAHRREITAGLDCEVETIGWNPGADWTVAYDPATRQVRVSHHGRVAASWRNTLSGAHNAMNAATAFVLAVWAGASAEVVATSLAAFGGADRRMQFMGERAVDGGTVRVFDDYGHHPTEVEATLRAFRESIAPEGGQGRLIVVFQPHQHSRTRHLMGEFETSFSQADVVLVPHIYFVRDSQEEKQKVAADELVDRLIARGVNAMHLYPFRAIVDHLRATTRAGDTIVVMGAGDVWKVGRDFLA